jgi:hypothetical protein
MVWKCVRRNNICYFTCEYVGIITGLPIVPIKISIKNDLGLFKKSHMLNHKAVFRLKRLERKLRASPNNDFLKLPLSDLYFIRSTPKCTHSGTVRVIVPHSGTERLIPGT